jgi:hypothetical protein
MRWYGLGLSCSGQGPVEGSRERGIAPSGSEVLEQLHNWWLPKKAWALWSQVVTRMGTMAVSTSGYWPRIFPYSSP